MSYLKFEVRNFLTSEKQELLFAESGIDKIIGHSLSFTIFFKWNKDGHIPKVQESIEIFYENGISSMLGRNLSTDATYTKSKLNKALNRKCRNHTTETRRLVESTKLSIKFLKEKVNYVDDIHSRASFWVISEETRKELFEIFKDRSIEFLMDYQLEESSPEDVMFYL